MKISKEDAKKTALLAGIALEEEEGEKLAKELTNILEYFEKISELDTENIEPTNHILDIDNVYREDVVQESIPPEDVVKNAPKKLGNFIVVPKPIDEGNAH
jgi:aspartyl-tRNA(Asn)/glutamyl-tRNA(Gln) amidotransferase subunit C